MIVALMDRFLLRGNMSEPSGLVAWFRFREYSGKFVQNVVVPISFALFGSLSVVLHCCYFVGFAAVDSCLSSSKIDVSLWSFGG